MSDIGDTITTPTASMLNAIKKASLYDDVFEEDVCLSRIILLFIDFLDSVSSAHINNSCLMWLVFNNTNEIS
jgi:threonine aldolase